jgi:catechol-2,3-dioxygenase
MSGKNQSNFEGGINIAVKLPPHVFDQTVNFYKDVLRLPVIKEESASVVLEFGANRLWLDRAGQFSQAEIWWKYSLTIFRRQPIT